MVNFSRVAALALAPIESLIERLAAVDREQKLLRRKQRAERKRPARQLQKDRKRAMNVLGDSPQAPLRVAPPTEEAGSSDQAKKVQETRQVRQRKRPLERSDKLTGGEVSAIKRSTKRKREKCKSPQNPQGVHCGSKRPGVEPQSYDEKRECKPNHTVARNPNSGGLFCRRLSEKQIAARRAKALKKQERQQKERAKAKQKKQDSRGGGVHKKKSFKNLQSDIQKMQGVTDSDQRGAMEQQMRGAIRRQLGNMLSAGGMGSKMLQQLKENEPGMIKAFKRRMSGAGKNKVDMGVMTDPKALTKAFMDFRKNYKPRQRRAPGGGTPPSGGPSSGRGWQDVNVSPEDQGSAERDWAMDIHGRDAEELDPESRKNLPAAVKKLKDAGIDADRMAELQYDPETGEHRGLSPDDLIQQHFREKSTRRFPAQRAASLRRMYRQRLAARRMVATHLPVKPIKAESFDNFNPGTMIGDRQLAARYAVERTKHHTNIYRIARLAALKD